MSERQRANHGRSAVLGPEGRSVIGASRRVRFGLFVLAGLAVAAALAFFVSPSASGNPDGLNKVAIDEGFADTESPHALADAPTAGYEVRGVDDERLSTGLSGLIGVAVTFAVAGGLLLVVRRRSSGRRSPRDRSTTTATGAAGAAGAGRPGR